MQCYAIWLCISSCSRCSCSRISAEHTATGGGLLRHRELSAWLVPILISTRVGLPPFVCLLKLRWPKTLFLRLPFCSFDADFCTRHSTEYQLVATRFCISSRLGRGRHVHRRTLRTAGRFHAGGGDRMHVSLLAHRVWTNRLLLVHCTGSINNQNICSVH